MHAIRHWTLYLSLLLFIVIASCQQSKNIGETINNLEEEVNQLPPYLVDLEATLPLDPKVKHGKLANGFTYYIRKNQQPENRAEFRLVVNAGSLLEDDDQQGLDHFVEHMAFNGTKHFEKNDLINFLESMGIQFGADLNAYTSFDETVYMLQVPTDSAHIVSKAMLVMEDWASGLLFDNEEVEKERGVVLSEWRSRLGPNQRMQNKYFPVLYKHSQYAERLPIGDTAVVKHAPKETLERFYKDWYRPNLMSLIVVGDVNVGEIENEIKKRFGTIKNPSNERERTDFEVHEHRETYVSIVTDKEAAFSNVRLLYKHERSPLITAQDYREDIKRRLYNGMLNNRLDELARKTDPPFMYAFSSYGHNVRTMDSYMSYAFTEENSIVKGLEALLIENERVKQHGFTSTELERRKKAMLNSFEDAVKEKDKTESVSYASEYIRHFLDQTTAPGIELEFELMKHFIDDIKLDEINQLANQWITEANRVVVVTAPEKEGYKAPSESDVRDVLEREIGILTPYEDEVDNRPLMRMLPQPGNIIKSEKHDLHDINSWTLSNGIKVHFKTTDFQNDEVIFSSFSPGGHSLISDDDYFSAIFADQIITDSGIDDIPLKVLQKKLTGKSVSVQPYIGELEEGVSGRASPKDLKTMFQLIHLYLTKPRVDQENFDAFIQREKTIYANLDVNPDYYYSKMVSKITTNDHFRRRMLTAADFDKIDLQKSLEIYQDRFANISDLQFVFVGNINPDTLKYYSELYLASLPSTKNLETWKDINITSPKGKVIETIKKGSAPKANVLMIYHGETKWTRKDSYLLNATTDILSIMLRESMREDQGNVYGVGVSGGIDRRPKEGYTISVKFNCDPNEVDGLIKTIHHDIDSLVRNGPDAINVAKIKEQERRQREQRLKKNSFWRGKILASLRYNDSFDLIDVLAEYQEYLTIEEIQATAKKYLSGENYIQIVRMPEDQE